MSRTPFPSSRPRRLLALLMAATLVGALLPATVAPVAAEPEPASASAAGFAYFKHPAPPVCTGSALNVSAGPFFKRSDCGFATFAISGASANPQVSVAFVGPSGGAPFATQAATFRINDGLWQFLIRPTPSWPAGKIAVEVSVDGALAGSSSFGNNLLGATLTVDPSGAPYAPGDDLPVSGNLHQLDNVSNLAGPSRTPVPATFTLVVITPTGEVRPIGGPMTASSDGNFSTTIPGSATADLTADESTNFEVTVSVAAIDATYTDPSTGAWAAADAGRTAVTLLATPDTLQLRASFVSSTGWVKPGETFPFRVFVTNATDTAATGVSVTLTAPPSAAFVAATPLNAGETATVTSSSITWTLGTLPAATAAGPMVRTLVVTARAATLSQDPEVVWKDLSTPATLSYSGYAGDPITSSTHGPKVVPPAGGFETARYGDKPFPMVPVEYTDRERQQNSDFDNDAEKLDTVVNDPAFEGSTFNLYQEMSYGQLFPQGSVPSDGIATADFTSYAPGFEFSSPAATDATCRGATFGSAPALIGTPLYEERIQNGWYQLPGNTEYYGGDFPAFTLGVAGTIDSACGPLGKAVFDAAQIADPEIDYNVFDSDKDGVVDFFMLVFVGCGGNGASQVVVLCPYDVAPYDNIWPHSSSLESQFKDDATGLRGYISDDQLKSLNEVPQCWTSAARVQFDDCAANGGAGVDSLPVYVRVGPYNVNPETVFQSASVISHEYGHHLGLPDFYDAGGEVYGDLNLMAADYSQHMTIFSKQDLGWVVPEFLQPGESVPVSGWDEIKTDTGVIRWETPSGTPYTLSAANGDQNIHNGQAYGVKLPGRQIIDPAKVASQASATHVWHSGRGNDFGCSPTGAHNLDLFLPELRDVAAGSSVTLEFKSSWDIEWDFDYGFVQTTTDGQNYTSQPSEMGFTTDGAVNPHDVQCQEELGNGLTGTSGAFEAGPADVAAARVANDYSHGSPFLLDRYDISELAGQNSPVVRFSYSTDPAFDRPGWFIDDVVVRVNGVTRYSSNFESGEERGRLFPGGCDPGGFNVAVKCTDGWTRIDADAASPLDHAYYLELRDQSGFDYDGHGQSERGDTSWQPGLFIEYTDEAHGYGNNGTPPPPAQHYIDSNPIPGSDCVSEQNGNCADVSFADAAGDGHYDDFIRAGQPEGFVNSFEDPNTKYDDGFWHFDYNCLTVDVTAMSGAGIGPQPPAVSDLTANATLSAGDGCTPFSYGRTGLENAAPVAVAQARPTEAQVGEPVTFDGSDSTDDRQTPEELDYSWEFGDGETATGQTVQHAYGAPGTYTATLTVTDADGASDTDSVDVTVTGVPNLRVTGVTTVNRTGTGGGSAKPKAGDKVDIVATVTNTGTARAEASYTAFALDGQPLAGSPVATDPIPAGGSLPVTLTWDTRAFQGQHVIAVTADAVGNAVTESNEDDNTSTLTVTVRGNKVSNGSFEEPNETADGPAAWQGTDTGAGQTSWSDGGSHGQRSASITGTGGSVVLNGMPTWTSDPIAVTAGELMDLRVIVAVDAASSPPAAGLAYLGPAGELLNTVRLIELPTLTNGFQLFETQVSVPVDVAEVRVVLFGFSPTDLATAGTVTFDDVGLYGP